MDRLFIFRSLEVLPHLLGEERNERCSNKGKCPERVVQGTVCIQLVGVILVPPEATSVAPDVPVVYLVNECKHRIDCRTQIIVIERLCDIVYHLLGNRDYPAVKRIRTLMGVKFMAGTGNLVDVCILYEEAVAVPQRKNNALDDFTDTFVAVAQIIGADNRGVHKEQAQCIGAVHIDSLYRVGVVAQAL